MFFDMDQTSKGHLPTSIYELSATTSSWLGLHDNNAAFPLVASLTLCGGFSRGTTTDFLFFYKRNKAINKAAPWSNNEDQTFLICVPDKRTQRKLHQGTRNKVPQEVSDGYSGVSADIKPDIENS